MTFTSPSPPPAGSSAARNGGGPRRGRLTRIGVPALGLLLVLGAAGALLALGGGGGKPQAVASPRPAPSSAVPSPSVRPALPYVLLTPGTCFDHPDLTKGLARVTERPCTGPHDGEAIANVTVRGVLRNDAQVAAAVRKACAPPARVKAGRQAEGTRVFSFVLTPSAKLYREGYDQATCTLTGSETAGGRKLAVKLR